MMIKLLSTKLQSKLRSDVTIGGVSQCVEELVLNALDAQSTCVAVRIDLDTQKIQVVDNGCGIAKDYMVLLTQRYATSKCHQIEDLESLQYYGYRGEALASIRDMCYLLEIETRVKSSSQTHVLVVQRGKVVQQSPSRRHRPSPGTTVTVYELFHQRHVRVKCLNKGVEMQKTKQRLEAITLMHHAVSFSLKDEVSGKLVLQTHTSGSITGAFSHLFGGDLAQHLCEIFYTKEPFCVHGYVSTQPVQYSHHQLVYVNKRLVLKTKIHKLVNRLLRKSLIAERKSRNATTDKCAPTTLDSPSSPNVNSSSVVYIINVKCPLSEYDITFDPSKTLVAFKHWDTIADCVCHAVLHFIQENGLLQSEELDRIVPDTSPFLASCENPIDVPVDKHKCADRYADLISTANLANTLHSKTARRQAKPDALNNVCSELPQNQNIQSNNSVACVVSKAAAIPAKDIPGGSLSEAANHGNLTSKNIVKNLETGQKRSDAQTVSEVKSTASELSLKQRLTVTDEMSKLTEQETGDANENLSKLGSSLAIMRMNHGHSTQQEEHNSQPTDSADTMTNIDELYARNGKSLSNVHVYSSTSYSSISTFWKNADTNRSESAGMKESTELHRMQRIKRKLSSEKCSSNDTMSSMHKLKCPTKENFDKMRTSRLSDVHRHLSTSHNSDVKQRLHKTNVGKRIHTRSLLSGLLSVKRKLNAMENTPSHSKHSPGLKPAISKNHSLLSGLCKVKEKLKTDSSCQESKPLHLHQTAENTSCHKDNKGALSTRRKRHTNESTHANTKSSRVDSDQDGVLVKRCSPKHVQRDKVFTLDINTSECFEPVLESTNLIRSMIESKTRQVCGKGAVDVDCAEVNYSRLLENDHNIVPQSYHYSAIPSALFGLYAVDSSATSQCHVTSPSKRTSPHVHKMTYQVYPEVRRQYSVQEPHYIHDGHTISSPYFSFLDDNYRGISTHRVVNVSAGIETEIPDIYDNCHQDNTVSERYEMNAVDMHDCIQLIKDTDERNLLPELVDNDSQGFCTDHLLKVAANEEPQTNGTGLQCVQSYYNELEGVHVNEELHVFQMSGESQGLKFIKESQGFHVTMHSQGCHVNNESLGFQVNKDSQEHKINMESQGFLISNESQGCGTSHESQGFNTGNEANIQTNSQSQTVRFLTDSQRIQANNEIQRFQMSNECQEYPTNTESQGFQTSTECRRFQMNDEHQASQTNSELQGFQINSGLQEFQMYEHNTENKEQFQIGNNKKECQENSETLSKDITDEMANELKDSTVYSQLAISSVDTENDKTMEMASHKKDSSGAKNLQSDTAESFTSKLPDNWMRITNSGRDVYVNMMTGNTYDHLPDIVQPSTDPSTPEISNYNCTALLPRPRCERLNKLDCAPMSPHSLESFIGMLRCHLERMDEQEHIKWKGGLDAAAQALQTLNNWTNPMFKLPEQAPIRITASESTRSANQVHQTLHSLTFTKDMIHNIKILRQVDNKFIACLMSSDNKTATRNMEHHLLVLVDQHAAHERVRLEQFTREVYDDTVTDRKIRTVKLESPVYLTLSKDHVLIMCMHREAFHTIGVEFSIVSDEIVHVSSVPYCLLNKEKTTPANEQVDKDLLKNLLSEHIELLRRTSGASHCLPNTIHQMLCSRSCHGAIKFGDTLSIEDCMSLLQSLSHCQLPFQCAHGRPAFVPILDLHKFTMATNAQQVKKVKKAPKLWKMKASNLC